MRFDSVLPPLFIAAALCGGCGSSKTPPPLTASGIASAKWEDIVLKARGTEVSFAMWAGDDRLNGFIRSEIARKLKDDFGITLRIVPLGDTVEGVNKLLNEKAAGKTSGGTIDFIWINGENFRAAKQGGVLWGPFSSQLPNVSLYDEAAIKQDFGTPIDGMEAPWEKTQFVLAYDSVRVPSPPRTIEALRSWVKTHPGRFTYIAPPDFTGSAFVRHVLVHAGAYDPGFWNGFHGDLYDRAASGAIAYLNGIKPYLWRKGETYPPSLSELNRLFANNEVDFAMSYGPSFASVLIERGEFPATARTLVWNQGAIGNFSFLAIAFNANNAAGALVAINELISFETGLAMSRQLGHLTPHRLASLTPEQRALVNSLPRGSATLSLDELGAHFLPEPDAEYLNRFDRDWNAKVLRQ